MEEGRWGNSQILCEIFFMKALIPIHKWEVVMIISRYDGLISESHHIGHYVNIAL